jgi:hypothetical protein
LGAYDGKGCALQPLLEAANKAWVEVLEVRVGACVDHNHAGIGLVHTHL